MDATPHLSRTLPPSGLAIVLTVAILVLGGSAVLAPVASASMAPVGTNPARPASFTVNITFEQTGLPTGDVWSATLGGSTHSGMGTTISFLVPNATYSFSVQTMTGYVPVPSSGTVNATTGNQTTGVFFYPPGQPVYLIDFQATGLPPGAAWLVRFGTYLNTSQGASIGFLVPNGTYAYQIPPSGGWFPRPSSGSIMVQGRGQTVPIAFAPVLFNVTFDASGLVPGTLWVLVFNATRYPLQNLTMTFREPNGSTPYSVEPVNGYTVTPSHGWANVTGSNVVTILRFSNGSGATFPVTFSESGLPSGSLWGLSVDGTNVTSSAASFVLPLRNGTHDYLVLSVPGYPVKVPFGTVEVSGLPASVTISFQSKAPSSPGFLATYWPFLVLGVGVAAIVAAAILLYVRYYRKPPTQSPSLPPPKSPPPAAPLRSTPPALPPRTPPPATPPRSPPPPPRGRPGR